MEEAVWAFFDELADMDDRTIVTATALFDFDAQEPNEISFSEVWRLCTWTMGRCRCRGRVKIVNFVFY